MSLEVAAQLNALGCGLKEARKFTAAAVAFERARAMLPHDQAVLTNLASALLCLGRYAEAERRIHEALALAPDYALAHAVLGVVFTAQERFEEAERCLNRGLELDPSDFRARWNRACCRLAAGDWSRGLVDYEARFQHSGPGHYPRLPVPLWDGVTDLNGKRLYVQFEQGAGDRILLSRYLVWLKERWPRVELLSCVNPSLVNLLWGYARYVTFLPDGVPWPDCDLAVYSGSLPLYHGTTPTSIPPDPGLILARALEQSRRGPFNLPRPTGSTLKVGISWTGNPGQERNHDRSIPLELLATLAEDPGLTLYGLQVGEAAGDIERLGLDGIVCNLDRDLRPNGFIATAAAMLQLDAVVTVCTSTAHLAGALGVPCYVLLGLDPYWIWLRGLETTAWYPSVKLLRQTRYGEWGGVVERARLELAERPRSDGVDLFERGPLARALMGAS